MVDGYPRYDVEFYNPDYSINPPVTPDYRRTIYWNPYIETDPDKPIIFFNGSKSSRLDISVAYMPII